MVVKLICPSFTCSKKSTHLSFVGIGDINMLLCLSIFFSVQFFIAAFTNIIDTKLLFVGFHLSGVVTHNSFKSDVYNVAVTFDRCQIISCSCSCRPNATWCSHITALCIYRIRHPNQVCFRAPVSESLSRLHRDQLQKFAQYLINELPPQVHTFVQCLHTYHVSQANTHLLIGCCCLLVQATIFCNI